MITWKKLDAGEYDSTDERFHIIKTWDRIYGNHWELYDREDTSPDNPNHGMYCEDSLKECKRVAEWILRKEKEDKTEFDMSIF